jgi:hypothetical protein
MQSRNIMVWIAIFLLGAVAGFGLGNVYGANTYQAQLEQKVTDLQSRFDTVNENYMTLVREYNRLFALKAPAASAASPVAAVSSPAAPKPATTPAAPAANPTTAAKPAASPAATGAAKATTAPAAGKAKVDFKALTVDGTGPLEGPPPIVVKFTDLSTLANPTSYKWEFGDGQTSTDKNPEHKYDKACPGDKQLCTVKLTVCNADGCVTASKPDYLWISESCTGC